MRGRWELVSRVRLHRMDWNELLRVYAVRGRSRRRRCAVEGRCWRRTGRKRYHGRESFVHMSMDPQLSLEPSTSITMFTVTDSNNRTHQNPP
jgi:endonuclease I